VIWVRVLLISTIFSFGNHAIAITNGLAVTGGVYQNNILNAADDGFAGDRLFDDIYFPIGIQYSLPVFDGWNFAPTLSLTQLTTLIVPKETPEDGAKKNLIYLNLPLVTNLRESVDGKLGLGILRYEVRGEGGTVNLQNGTGTSTFYQPSKTTSSVTTYLLFGLAFPFTKWQLDWDLIVHAPADNDRRSYSMAVYMTYPLGIE